METAPKEFSNKQKLLLKRWSEALRSGKYKQTTGTLKSMSKGVGYCCLGVLCDIVDTKKWTTNEDGGDPLWEGEESSLPARLRKELGLSESEISAFIELNDDFGATFEEIADVIDTIRLSGTVYGGYAPLITINSYDLEDDDDYEDRDYL